MAQPPSPPSPERRGGDSSARGPRRGGDPRRSPHRADRSDRSDRPQRPQRPQRTSHGERSRETDPRDRPQRPPRASTLDVPEIPDDITASMLDKSARARLRTLSKDNAEDVGRHLVMAGGLIDDDPELAYKHAQVALARGGRVDIVREAAALTAYATQRWAEALKEFRTVRRLSGDISYLPHMADCERGLGRPERAIALSREPDAGRLPEVAKAELAIVVAGARLDLGQPEAAYAGLMEMRSTDPTVQQRRDFALVPVLEALGRTDQAAALVRALAEAVSDDDPEVVVYDLADGEPDLEPEPDEGDAT